MNPTFVIYTSHLRFKIHTLAKLRFTYHTFDLRTRVGIYKFQCGNAICKLHEITFAIYKSGFMIFCDL